MYDDDLKFLLISFAVIMITLLSINFVINKWNQYNEENDPNRDYYITQADNSLQKGEVYEKEFIPAHTVTKTKTEYEYGYGAVVIGADGNVSIGWGMIPTTVYYDVNIPDKYLLKIRKNDTERLIYYINDIEVSESLYNELDIGDYYND